MTPKQIDLARRVMALPGWEWRPGMFAQSGARVVHVFNSRASMILADAEGGWEERCRGRCELHLADPTGATDGVLLRMLGPGWTTWNRPDGTWSLNKSFDAPVVGATLAEACCLAADALGCWPGGAP